jgi:A/G-specific adenine glycosylase
MRDGKVALRRRPTKGLLAGLWEFPCEESAEDGARQLGISSGEYDFVCTGKHIFTHVEWHMRAFLVQTEEGTLPEGWVWVDKSELQHTYPIPNAYSTFISILDAYW